MKQSIEKKPTAPQPIKTYPALFCLFLFGSVAGFILEGIWCILTKGGWEHHSATVWGPFCIVYGFGAVAVYLLSGFLIGKHPLLQFAVYAVSGAGVEYFTSLFQEALFGSSSWDYSNQTLNLNGRISLRMSLIWGILGIVFARFIFPVLTRILEKIQGKGWKIACIAVTVFMAVNLLVTAAAILRWGDRQKDLPASGPVGQYFDRTYDNERMNQLFPNMVFPN